MEEMKAGLDARIRQDRNVMMLVSIPPEVRKGERRATRVDGYM